jgi:SAM-dependent methyltransferase
MSNPVGGPIYDARTLEASEGLVRYNQWTLGEVANDIGGRTLELGAGTGTISELIDPLCSELVLVEPAANLCAQLAERFRGRDDVTVWNGPIESVATAPRIDVGPGFDTIVSFNVLEHIPDDVAALREARDLLIPGGRLVLFVPSLPVLYGTLDERVDHVRRYTKRTLTAAIEAAGLDVVRIEYFDFLGMFPWFLIGRVLRRTSWGQSPSGGGLEVYDRLVVPVCRAFDRLIGPPVGKNLIAVGRRPE